MDGQRRYASVCDHGTVPPRSEELPSARVEADLRQRLAADEWLPGEALPSVAVLAAHYGVARGTVAKALRRLADSGLVRIVPAWESSKA